MVPRGKGVEMEIIWPVHPTQASSLGHVKSKTIVQMVGLTLHHEDVAREDQVLFGWTADQRLKIGNDRPCTEGSAINTVSAMQILEAGVIILGIELPGESCGQSQSVQVEGSILNLQAGIGRRCCGHYRSCDNAGSQVIQS